MDMILIMMMKMIIGSLSIVSISLLFENPAAFIILESESNFTRRVSNLFKICSPRFLHFPFSKLKKDCREFFWDEDIVDNDNNVNATASGILYF